MLLTTNSIRTTQGKKKSSFQHKILQKEPKIIKNHICLMIHQINELAIYSNSPVFALLVYFVNLGLSYTQLEQTIAKKKKKKKKLKIHSLESNNDKVTKSIAKNQKHKKTLERERKKSPGICAAIEREVEDGGLAM